MSGNIVVLAVTKMLSGMCTGGISLATRKWVRPVKEFGTVLRGDLTYRDKTSIQPFDIVDFTLLSPRPKPPHNEDWICDLVRVRPILRGRLVDRLQFLEKHTEPDSAVEILQASRSLALIEPSNVEAFFRLDSYSGKYDVRLRVSEMGGRPLPVTDIRWRALGRQMIIGREELCLSYDDICEKLGVGRIFVALGLSRLHEGRHWPMVIGVHTWPDYNIEIDYKNL